jgi:23S rRNA (uracil1939-C5)-methyltransferase
MQGRVENVGGSGDGVVDQDGTRWFVPLAAPGDLIEFEKLKGQGRGGPDRGRLTRVIERGPDRADAPCPHYGRCGGCAMQHVSHDFTTSWKLDQLRAALARRGFDDVPISVGLEGAAGQRRRTSLTAIRQGEDKPIVGFHERRGRNVVATRVCPVLEPGLEDLLVPLRQMLQDVQQPRSEMRISLNMTDGGVDMLLDGGLTTGLAAHEVLTGFAEDRGLARISIAEGGVPWTVLERRPPVLDWDPLKVTPPAGTFLQADRAAEAYMRAVVAEWADPAAGSVDLFSGVGTLTSALPLLAGTLAVDSDEAAINGLRNGLDASRLDVRTSVRNLFRRPLQKADLAPFDQAVMDPPAAGAREQSAELAGSDLSRVIYISCAPPTFARDARTLCDGGFVLREVRMIDQFYWSPDVELAALFERV